ncbi:hypothetical protein [Thalassobacillus pellis]|uniref:hypothetical protein n=1 Tax=Thalassobacillus pellis TaxID=748008 RepID=UPI0019600DD1|nr:hypothetical protein [Thalassobacillus pellis]
MNRKFIHFFNIVVGILLILEGGLYIFLMNKDKITHFQSIITTILLLIAWGISYYKQLKTNNKTAWLTVTIIIMVPMILPWLFFI